MKRKFTMHGNKSSSKKRQRPALILENSPPVNTLGDLIEIGKSIKFFRNLDTVMLWRIVPYLEELDKMIGMKSLKETIFFQVIYYLKGFHKNSKNDEYLHTVIFGPPGSGKTSVAKIIGKIYQHMEVLSSDGPFKIAYRDDFIGEYVGHTAVKTRKLLKSCLGGVLFIDEVYSLSSGKKDKDTFSKEALDTLTAFLSENKNNFCCIIAGYEEDIKNCFFAANDGLERRFTWRHKIEEYKSEELSLIFDKKIGEINWNVAFSKEYLIKEIEKSKKLFKFAGGSIETFLGKMKMIHAKRVFNLDRKHMFVFTKEDVQNTIKYIEENNKEVVENDPPYGMYV